MENTELQQMRARTLEKVASSGGASEALKMIGVIGAGVIVAQFIKRMINYAEDKFMQAQSPGYYKVMLEKNPHLLEADPNEVMALWDTLYKNAPNLAQDPTAAGAFITQNVGMRTMRDLGGPGLDTYKALTDIEKSKHTVSMGPDATSGSLSIFKDLLGSN